VTWLKELISEPGRAVPPVGTFMKIPSIETVEIVKLAGFDFIVLDAEHALLSLADLNRMILVARAIGISPIVRVPDHGYGDVQRILDAGAAGLFFPHVSVQEHVLGDQRAAFAAGVHPADDPAAGEQRHREVAALALGRSARSTGRPPGC
jgi:2-keto-3-deoxy-L-rhamnonate aldolase RhmA